MRVNISYSAHIDDVPHELARLVEDVSNHLGAAAMQLGRIKELMTAESGITNAAETARLIDAVRRQMAKMDTRLLESETILGGYYQVKTDPDAALTQQQEVEELEPTGAPQIEEALNGIQEELQQLIPEPQAEVAEEAEHADL
jgi:hypothetical protein